ncbi:hypothetical protein JCM19237_330 [Photobacterium aphoticum]|uniref:Uncharacterized protein n=1 Tax=Photobacterium aphoticum TaxID=754436 RepID=A0A090QXN0_9GAMM|nr:hypothetical protein JCM19237_330 [Photobacterium aphoticum]
MPYQFTVDGKEVNIDIDLRELGNTSSVLSIAPEVPIEFEVNGRKLNAKVVPLNGHAMEAIEMARVSRSNHEPNSVPYRKLSNRIAMLEMTHGMRIDGEPPLLEPAIEYRGKLIMEMEIDTEFRAFFAAMTAARRKLTHGLATVYKDGVYLLVTMRELAEGKGEQPIMFPFQANNFLPAI